MTGDSTGRPKTGINPIGLRKRPSYEEAINYLQNDQEIVRYPDRYAKQLRESPWMTQLDADGNDDVTAMAVRMGHQAARKAAAQAGSVMSKA